MSVEQRVERVREVFGDWAQRGRAEGMEAAHGFAARQAFDQLELPRAGRYLDVGCGNGYTVRWARDQIGPEGRAVGIDVSERMIAHALARSDDGCEFHQATFPHHGFEPGIFDAVFSMETLYYIADVDEALRAIHDLLTPGGRFACVLDYYEENEATHTWPEDLDCELTLLSGRGWREAFERAGFAVEAQERILYPLAEDATPSWKQDVGSLFTLGRRT